MDESKRAARVESGVCSYSGYGTFTEWASLGEMAAQYWSDHAKTGEASYGPAQQFVAEFIELGDVRALEVIQALVDAAHDDADVDYVGAGPLEDLVSHGGHGMDVVAEVERRARQDPQFRLAVSGVWLGRSVPESLRVRLGALGAKLI